MACKIKGIYKGFKYITQIFVVKEREMEIGHPTDVKHLAHVGSNGSSGNAPSWMNEFKTTSQFSATSIGNIHGHGTRGSNSAISAWSSQDFESNDGQPAQDQLFKVVTDIPNKKKQKRKKPKPMATRRSTSAKYKSKFAEGNGRLDSIEVM